MRSCNREGIVKFLISQRHEIGRHAAKDELVDDFEHKRAKAHG